MSRLLGILALTPLLLAAPLDDFQREGGPKRRAALRALEGRRPPALHVDQWMNGAPLDLEELRGRVVVLDFWGYW